MRKLFISVLIGLLIITSCGKSKKEREVKGNTKISGIIQDGQGKVIIVGRSVNRQFKEIDKDSLEDNTFILGVELKNPEVIYLQILSNHSNYPLFVEPGKNIKLETDANFSNVKIIEGSPSSIGFNEFIRLLEEYRNKENELGIKFKEAQQSGNKAEEEKIRKEYYKLQSEKLEKLYQLAEANKDNVAGAIILESLSYNQDADFGRLKTLYESLPDEIKQTTYAKNAWNNIKNSLVTAIGQKAPDFEAPTPDGKTLKMSDVLKKSKVLVLDFWASWCRPCRVENPYVVEIYKKYHDKGLNILSISLDKPDAKDKWLKAIKDDQLNWYHVSNLKHWQDPVARKYGINSIPATLILDKNGVIRAKNLRRQDLENKIKELLNE